MTHQVNHRKTRINTHHSIKDLSKDINAWFKVSFWHTFSIHNTPVKWHTDFDIALQWHLQIGLSNRVLLIRRVFSLFKNVLHLSTSSLLTIDYVLTKWQMSHKRLRFININILYIECIFLSLRTRLIKSYE